MDEFWFGPDASCQGESRLDVSVYFDESVYFHGRHDYPINRAYFVSGLEKMNRLTLFDFKSDVLPICSEH